MQIKSYSVDCPIKGITKQHAVWGYDTISNSTSPIIYLQRPKWIKDDAVWGELVNSIRLDLPKGFEVK